MQPQQASKKTLSLFATLLLFGTAFLTGGMVLLWSSHIPSDWQQTEGRITGSVYSPSQRGTGTYSPIVSYQVAGITYEARGSSGKGSSHVAGEIHKVAYNPDQPDEAKVVEGAGSKMLSLLCALLGAGMLVFAVRLKLKGRH